MNLKRTLSAAVLSFALLMTPAFVACSPDDNKTEIETPDNPENPEPNPEPEPEPIKPGTTGGWFELPYISDTDKNGIDDNDKTLYYAYHYCAGREKGPDGKIARNFATC